MTWTIEHRAEAKTRPWELMHDTGFCGRFQYPDAAMLAAMNQDAPEEEIRFIDMDPKMQEVVREMARQTFNDFPDKVAYLADGWAVRFRGEIQSPRWKDYAGAAIFLRDLRDGRRNPEPETR